MLTMVALSPIAHASSVTPNAQTCRWSKLDIATVLSCATQASCRTRKKAALVLAGVMRRTNTIHSEIDPTVEEVRCRYGNEVAAAARMIASELQLI